MTSQTSSQMFPMELHEDHILIKNKFEINYNSIKKIHYHIIRMSTGLIPFEIIFQLCIKSNTTSSILMQKIIKSKVGHKPMGEILKSGFSEPENIQQEIEYYSKMLKSIIDHLETKSKIQPESKFTKVFGVFYYPGSYFKFPLM
jgi:hypothetical protein